MQKVLDAFVAILVYLIGGRDIPLGYQNQDGFNLGEPPRGGNDEQANDLLGQHCDPDPADGASDLVDHPR